MSSVGPRRSGSMPLTTRDPVQTRSSCASARLASTRLMHTSGPGPTQCASPTDLKSIHAGLSAALSGGVARPVVAREFPLDLARKAHEAVMAPGALGKIVLIP